MYPTASKITSTYNELTDVALADQALSTAVRYRAIDVVLAVIRAHRLEKYVGLRLLHKHNEIAHDEIMLEDSRVDDEGFALITRATSIAGAAHDIAPNSWILCDDGFVPFEFSRTFLLRDSMISPATSPVFFQDLAIALRKEGLTQLVGPALTPSAAVEAHRPENADVMLELSAIGDRANVLRYAVSKNLLIGLPIETFWAAGDTGTSTTSTPAEPEKVTPARVCTKICPSVQNPPVHQGTYIHNQS